MGETSVSFPGTTIRLVADDLGRLVEVNDAASEILGYSRSELLAVSIWDLTPPPVELDGLALWQEFIRSGHQEGVYVLITKRGGRIRFHYRARANIAPGRHESLLNVVGVPIETATASG